MFQTSVSRRFTHGEQIRVLDIAEASQLADIGSVRIDIRAVPGRSWTRRNGSIPSAPFGKHLNVYCPNTYAQQQLEQQIGAHCQKRGIIFFGCPTTRTLEAFAITWATIGNSVTGVTLKIWFEGNFTMKARDIDNLNNNAASLQFYGIDPPAGQSRSFDIGSGNPGYVYFILDAPAYDFSVNGNPDFVGAFTVKTLNGNGNTTWHYDEALASAGLVTSYQRASWVEDPR